MSTSIPASPIGVSGDWQGRRNHLFVASCVALIATAMSFAIRANLIGTLGDQFHLDKAQMGLIVSTAFWGFPLAMMIGGPLCDVVGMRRLLVVALIGHAIGIVGTILATNFWWLFLSTLAIGLANGFVEAACNPLIATLYPDQKIRRLNFFHAWFPGGIVIGGLVAFAVAKLPLGGVLGKANWQLQMATMFVPLVIYGIMFIGREFPQTERAASGVSSGEMVSECMKPFFLLFVGCMLLTGATELATGTWVPDILGARTGVGGDSILFLVWYTGLMAVGRNFAGPIVHRISPVALLLGSSVFSAVGIYLLASATGATMAAIAVTIFAIGVCFFWPTMLGVVSERFPKSGALGMAIVGGAGMLSTAVFLPIIGGRYDVAIAAAKAAGQTEQMAKATGGSAALSFMVYLPLILIVVFAAMFFYDKSHGGYKQVHLANETVETPAEPAAR